MKKLISIVLAVILGLFFVACGNGNETPEPVTPADASEEPAETTAAWQEFLTEYEEWVDAYVEFIEQYNANPSDPDILSEYTALSQEALEWPGRVAEIEGDLATDEAALEEFLQATARINQKLTEATAGLLEQAGAATGSESSSTAAAPASSGATVDWETFLTEYEEWVDAYAVFAEKYNANPADTSLLSDYATLTQEALEWPDKVAQMESDLASDAAALEEFLQATARISQKLTEATADLLG